MGKGGEQVAPPAKNPVLDHNGIPVPTLAEVRASIPKHCFKHSVPRALALVVRDTCVIGTFGGLAWLRPRERTHERSTDAPDGCRPGA